MQCRVADLRCKEVINVCDGTRYGLVCDVLVDVVCGKLVAIVVPGPYRFLGMFGRAEDLVIPWESIKRIGDDIILVDYDGRCACAPPERRPRRW